MTVIDNREYISINEALEKAAEKGIEVSLLTMITWVKKWGISIQPGGTNTKIWVDRIKFEEKINATSK